MGKGEKKFSTIAQHCAPTMTSGCDPGYTTARGHGVYMEWMYKVRATSPGQLYVGAVGLGARGTQRLLTYQLRLALDPECLKNPANHHQNGSPGCN
jgi:hypothetical protein